MVKNLTGGLIALIFTTLPTFAFADAGESSGRIDVIDAPVMKKDKPLLTETDGESVEKNTPFIYEEDTNEKTLSQQAADREKAIQQEFERQAQIEENSDRLAKEKAEATRLANKQAADEESKRRTLLAASGDKLTSFYAGIGMSGINHDSVYSNKDPVRGGVEYTNGTQTKATVLDLAVVHAFVDSSGNKWDVHANFLLKVSSSIDFDVNNSKSLGDPSFQSGEFGASWYYSDQAKFGGSVLLDKTSANYHYPQSNQDFSDSVSLTAFSVYADWMNRDNRVHFGVRVGATLGQYKYTSDVMSKDGSFSNFNTDISGMSTGLYGEFKLEVPITQDFAAYGSARFQNTSITSPEISGSSTNYSLGSISGNRNDFSVGVKYSF